MSRRARRGIDMLPLLDVFMVVLFVFATIQETKLDDSTTRLETLEREREVLRERAEAAEAREAGLRGRLAAAEIDADAKAELDDRVAEYERACGPPTPESPCPAIQLEPREAEERVAIDDLLARLYENVAVFEIELDGMVDPERPIRHNPCCWRRAPPKGEWHSCGSMPSDADERRAWIDDGGEGLMAALRSNQSGDVIVMLRQGKLARYRQTNDLSDLLRQRLPKHVFYDLGSVDKLSCPLLAR